MLVRRFRTCRRVGYRTLVVVEVEAFEGVPTEALGVWSYAEDCGGLGLVAVPVYGSPRDMWSPVF